MIIFYFAYGSNMKTEKMESCIPSSKVIGCARIPDKRLVFNKKSVDSSTKANLADSAGDVVWGILYEFDRKELDKSDRVEGGYQRYAVQVLTDQNKYVTAFTYISKKIVSNILPYEWYKKLIIEGAYEHQLPKDYIEYLKILSSKCQSEKRTY